MTLATFTRPHYPELYARAIAHAYYAGFRIYDPSTAAAKDPDFEAKIMRMPAIAAPLNLRHHAISGRQGRVIAPEEAEEPEKLQAKVANQLLGNIDGFDASRLTLARADVTGARYAKIVKRAVTASYGDGKPRTWIVPTRLVDIPKENFRWHPIKDSPEPKARLEYARKRSGTITWVPIPPFAPLIRHVINDSEEMLGHGRGLRDVLHHLTLAIGRIFTANVKGAERYGHGWLVLKLDSKASGSPTLTNTKLVSESQTALNRMRADYNFIVGEGDTLEMLGPPSASINFMLDIQKHLEQMADRVIMGASLFAGGGDQAEGSKARAETEADTASIIFDSLSDQQEETLTRDLVVPSIRDNRENFAALGCEGCDHPRYSIVRGRKQDPREAAERAEIVLRSVGKMKADEYWESVQFSKPGDEDDVVEYAGNQQGESPFGGGFQFRDGERVLVFQGGGFDESKVKRDKGKFAKQEGAGADTTRTFRESVLSDPDQRWDLTGREVGAAFAPTGDRIEGDFVGRSGDVRIPSELRDAVRGGSFSHSHPNGTALSPVDVWQAASLNLQTIEAFGKRPDGSVFISRFNRVGDQWPGHVDVSDWLGPRLKRVDAEHEKAHAEIMGDESIPYAEAQAMSRAAKDRLLGDLYRKMADHFGGIRYDEEVVVDPRAQGVSTQDTAPLLQEGVGKKNRKALGRGLEGLVRKTE